jgi:hypothetical protein
MAPRYALKLYFAKNHKIVLNSKAIEAKEVMSRFVPLGLKKKFNVWLNLKTFKLY